MMIRTRTHPYARFVNNWLGTINEFENRSYGLALDVEEGSDAYTLRANLPGIKLEDIDLSIHDDVLTISAETTETEIDGDSRVLIRERRRGQFTRSLRFPVDVRGDGIAASFDNGVLNILVPKAEQARPRQIPVNAAETENQAMP